MVKISDMLQTEQLKISAEYYVPKQASGVERLFDMHARVTSCTELSFCSITWRKGSEQLTMDIAKKLQSSTEVLMHLTCGGLSEDRLLRILAEVRSAGIQNILALRGDDTLTGHCDSSLELVRSIRSACDQAFCIGVAGYPELHPSKQETGDPTMYFQEIGYLKQKVQAGADFIITQICYDTKKYCEFVRDCRAHGITVPIVPGICPITTVRSLDRLSTLCKIKIPSTIQDTIRLHKHEDETKVFGTQQCIAMCKDLLQHDVSCLHFYTMNKPDVMLNVIKSVKDLRPQSAGK